MKFRILLGLIFLALVISSSAIQIKESTSLTRRHRHRNNRSLRKLKMKGMLDDLWDAIKDIFNEKDFKFTLGGTLKLDENINFPYSISYSVNAKGEWDWTHSPKTQKEIDEATKDMDPKDLEAIKAKYTDSDNQVSLSDILEAVAADGAQAFLEKLVELAASALLVAIFPPIAPIVAIWILINQVGVFAAKNEELSVDGKIIYNIGFKFGYTGTYGESALFALITVNFTKISNLIDAWTKKLLEFLKNAYETLVPEPVRKALGAAADAVKAATEECKKMYEGLQTKWLELKNKIKESVKTLVNDIKNSAPVKYVLDAIQTISAGVQWVKDQINQKWSKVKNFVKKLSAKVVNALKSAYTNAVEWLSNVGKSVLDWFTSWWRRRMSYRRLFRVANRRYFNNLRRFKRSRRH